MFVNPLNLLQGKKTKEKSDKEKALDAKMEAAMNQAIRERNEQKAKEAASHVHQLVQPELSPQDVKSQTHVKEEPVNQLEAAPLNAASSLSLPESDMTGSGERGGAVISQAARVAEGSPEPQSDSQPKQERIEISEEYLQSLRDGVSDNTIQIGLLIESYNNLLEFIKALKVDTVEQLSVTSFKLQSAESELEALRTERDERRVLVDNLSLEKNRLQMMIDSHASTLESKEHEIESLKKEQEQLRQALEEKDKEIASLKQESLEAAKSHADIVAQVKSECETSMAELQAKHEEEIAALNTAASNQVEQVRKSVDSFVPAAVCDLFDYRVGDECEDTARWQAIYAYLGFINGSLRQEVFVKRFREFDASLYDAMRDTPDLLLECRSRVQRHINDELGKKSGGLLVCWPNAGDAFNPDCYTSTSEFGQRISEVISAMVYKKDPDGKVLCLNKGRVATA